MNKQDERKATAIATRVMETWTDETEKVTPEIASEALTKIKEAFDHIAEQKLTHDENNY